MSHTTQRVISGAVLPLPVALGVGFRIKAFAGERAYPVWDIRVAVPPPLGGMLSAGAQD